jgi:hypothetical protein
VKVEPKGSATTTRNQVVSVRLEPRLKYAAELAAQKQRRTLSSFIEWAIERAAMDVGVWNQDDEPSASASAVATLTWDVYEADRVAKLAFYSPQLLSYDQEKVWKAVQEDAQYWKNKKGDKVQDNFDFPRLRENWDELKQQVAAS